ncbi:rod shape-determining protein MreC [Paracoccaceae bacterium GXU_MW_L88]
MAREAKTSSYGRPIRRIFIGLVCLVLLIGFALWRIESTRIDRIRNAAIDQIVPRMEFLLSPISVTARMVRDFRGYTRLYNQNLELRRELRIMQSWKEAALQLEQENARLLSLNNVKLSPRLTYVTGEVLTDSGSPFSQSALINIGRRDGVQDGWAAMDGLGLVGRVAGVGEDFSRILFLTDASSRVPIVVRPSGQRGIVSGDNSEAPIIEFLDDPKNVYPGDRIVTSGDGGIFPPDLLVGQVAQDPEGRIRVRLAAEYRRIEFLRLLREKGVSEVSREGNLLTPEIDRLAPVQGPEWRGE